MTILTCRRILLFLIIAVVSTTMACHSARQARYKGKIEEQGRMDYCIVSGPNEVLELYKFDHFPLIPFFYGGYDLLLEINPQLVKSGQTLQIPSAGVKVKMNLLGHPVRPAEKISGSISFLSVEERNITANIVFTFNTPPERFQGVFKFYDKAVPFCQSKLASSPSTNKPDEIDNDLPLAPPPSPIR